MSSNHSFVEFIADQLQEAGVITCKKLFGEYGIWCNGKIVAFICDDRFLLKSTDAVCNLYPNLPSVPLFEGARAKYLYIENVEDREFLAELVRITFEELPEPKPKKRRRHPT